MNENPKQSDPITNHYATLVNQRRIAALEQQVAGLASERDVLKGIANAQDELIATQRLTIATLEQQIAMLKTLTELKAAAKEEPA